MQCYAMWCYTARYTMHYDMHYDIRYDMIYRGYYTVARRYEFYVLVARTISHEWAKRTSEISLYSWRFSLYSTPIHWLVYGHMTSNHETVSRQMPWAGNTAKTMTSNGKQFTVTREMLTAVPTDLRWPDVVPRISARFSKIAFVLFCYITKHLITGPLRKSEFCFPRISMFLSTASRKTLRFSGNKIHSSPWDQSLSIKSHVLTEYFVLTKFAFLPGLHLHLVFLKWKVVCGTKVSKTKQAYICVLFNCCSLIYFNLLLCLFASSGIWWRFI